MALDPFGGEVARSHVNLDYAASTPLRPEARAAMTAYDCADFAGANPNSLHTLGRRAAARLEEARRDVARSFGARVRPSEVVFTSGGTESNQLALFGIAEAVREREPKRDRVVISAIEHDSILDSAGRLRAQGFTVDVVRPCRQGFIEASELERLLGDDVALVSVMLANNETGVIQPIPELAAVAHAHGARFHADAVQGWLHVSFDVDELGVDALSVAGHKVGASVGIGALYLRTRTPLRPLALGGGQERGLRPGTQDLRAILGLAAVSSALLPTVDAERDRVQALSDDLYRELVAHSGRIHPTMGDPDRVARLPGIVSVYVDGIDSEELILKLDVAGFEVSAASACSSGSLDASHVLVAMGVPRASALGSLRISFDDRVREADLSAFARAFLDIVE